jgi:hypothetical protein
VGGVSKACLQRPVATWGEAIDGRPTTADRADPVQRLARGPHLRGPGRVACDRAQVAAALRRRRLGPSGGPVFRTSSVSRRLSPDRKQAILARRETTPHDPHRIAWATGEARTTTTITAATPPTTAALRYHSSTTCRRNRASSAIMGCTAPPRCTKGELRPHLAVAGDEKLGRTPERFRP